MKKIYLPLLISGVFMFSGCAEMQTITNQLPGILTQQTGGINGVSNSTISTGLKEALTMGVNDGVLKLGQTNGFNNNSLARILLPEELQGVEKTLRSVGLGSLADQGLKLLNTAAEDAVSEAAPIFTNAITTMSFQDAANVLLGGTNAATNYLEQKTTTQLTTAFKPKVANSLGKVGADKTWSNIISKYNAITGKNINTDLNGYVTEQAIKGVFNMVAEKEAAIRGNSSLRTTNVLQQVFALQDHKM